jgi:hypothetical protein
MERADRQPGPLNRDEGFVGCELELADMDTVITVASDTLDDLLVPIRGESPGTLVRSYCLITSSGAAVVMIEFQAERVLLVDWRATEKFGTFKEVFLM